MNKKAIFFCHNTYSFGFLQNSAFHFKGFIFCWLFSTGTRLTDNPRPATPTTNLPTEVGRQTGPSNPTTAPELRHKGKVPDSSQMRTYQSCVVDGCFAWGWSFCQKGECSARTVGWTLGELGLDSGSHLDLPCPFSWCLFIAFHILWCMSSLSILQFWQSKHLRKSYLCPLGTCEQLCKNQHCTDLGQSLHFICIHPWRDGQTSPCNRRQCLIIPPIC